MRKFIYILLCLAMLMMMLWGCAANTTVPDTPAADNDHLPEDKISEIMETMNGDQLKATGELIGLCTIYSDRADAFRDYCQLVTDSAERELDQLDAAENALMAGTPLPMHIETDTCTELVTLLAVNEGDSLYSYGVIRQGEMIRSLRFTVGPDDSIEVNGRNYTANDSGIVEISYMAEASSSIRIIWNSDTYGRLVAQFGLESAPSDPIIRPQISEEDIPDLMSNEEFKETILTMSGSQITLIEDILSLIQELQEQVEYYEDLSGSAEVLYDLIHTDLAVAENALLNGIQFQMAVEFENYITTSFGMMAVESNSPVYTFPNPFGGLKGEKMVFVSIPNSTVTINGASFSANQSGIVEVPLEGQSIPFELDIQVQDDNLTYVVHMEGDGNELAEALPSVVSSDNSGIF